MKRNEYKLIDENTPNDNTCVVVVYAENPDKLDIQLSYLANHNIWPGKYRYRIVSPQLTPK